MEVPVFPTKRIKLEHSYAFDLEYTMPVKEEECSEKQIKIEINDDLIKTEPIEPAVDENCTFEYLDVPAENESHDQPPPTEETLTIKTEITEVPSVDVTIPAVFVKDPLELVRHDFQVVKESHGEIQNENKLVPQKQSEIRTRSKKRVAKEDAPDVTESKTFLRLQKEKDNLQKQIQKMRTDLKAIKAREKALQTELGARRMIEISLEEKASVSEERLQESVKQEKLNSKIILELNKKLVQLEKDNLVSTLVAEKARKDFTTHLDKVKIDMKRRDLEQAEKDSKISNLSAALSRVNAKFSALKRELTATVQKLNSTETAYTKFRMTATVSSQKMVELSKEIETLKAANEQLAKSVSSEKKLTRQLVTERDQLLQGQYAKQSQLEKDLGKQKQIVGSLTAALSQKVTECVTHKDTIKMMKLNYYRKSLETKSKIEELEKKIQELEKAQCEYCGF